MFWDILFRMFGLGNDMYEWRLQFSKYQLGSQPAIEELASNYSVDFRISGFVELPICPIPSDISVTNIEKISIYLTENIGAAKTGLFIDGPNGFWVNENIGIQYGDDFFLFASDSLNCSLDGCLLTLVTDTHSQCLVDEFGGIQGDL